MAITLANATRSASADAAVALFDAGDGAGYIEIRTGSKPANPETSVTGTLLVTIPLADPAYEAAEDGVAELAEAPRQATAVASGTAEWFRAYDGDDNPIFDGTVSGEGGGGDLVLSSTSVTENLQVTISSLDYVQPAS